MDFYRDDGPFDNEALKRNKGIKTEKKQID